MRDMTQSTEWLPRAEIERRVSEYLGRPWFIRTIMDCGDAASHPARVLTGDAFSVFVKRGKGPLAIDRFDRESAGLKFLAERARVRTPDVLGTLETADGLLLLLEGVTPAERTPLRWHEVGRALAKIHRVTSGTFGFSSHSYFGDVRQDNTPSPDWPSFYRDRRLVPRLEGAARSGHLPAALAQDIERIIARLPELCGPAGAPSLLHGDAHGNNVITTNRGPVFIDPAIHFGHPEIDLAWLNAWEPVPDEVFLGYQKDAAIDPGFGERIGLWRLAGWLAVVEADGAYLDRLDAAVAPYR